MQIRTVQLPAGVTSHQPPEDLKDSGIVILHTPTRGVRFPAVYTAFNETRAGIIASGSCGHWLTALAHLAAKVRERTGIRLDVADVEALQTVNACVSVSLANIRLDLEEIDGEGLYLIGRDGQMAAITTKTGQVIYEFPNAPLKTSLVITEAFIAGRNIVF